MLWPDRELSSGANGAPMQAFGYEKLKNLVTPFLLCFRGHAPPLRVHRKVHAYYGPTPTAVSSPQASGANFAMTQVYEVRTPTCNTAQPRPDGLGTQPSTHSGE